MLEREIEEPFVKLCRKVGIRFKKKNFADQLDRWMMLPGGAPAIIEFKAPGKVPTPLQKQALKELEENGYNVMWCSDYYFAVGWTTGIMATRISELQKLGKWEMVKKLEVIYAKICEEIAKDPAAYKLVDK